MAGLNETPSGDRLHIGVFGLRNAGKSTLVNALTGQELSIVNDRPGTTTDPVSKAMEILPLGPCLVTDTAGLDDDEGELGAQRVRKTYDVLKTTDVAIWVQRGSPESEDPWRQRFLKECEARQVRVLIFKSGGLSEACGPRGARTLPAAIRDTSGARTLPAAIRDTSGARTLPDVDELKRRIAALGSGEDAPRPVVADIVRPGELVVCVCPIDASAPKGRLILPQQQVVREILDAHATTVVCQVDELAGVLSRMSGVQLVITDSQAFGAVSKIVPKEVPLTSFSILFARAKGDLSEFCRGAARLPTLRDGDCVLISEGCTHHRQCNDIGTVKLPAWLQAYTGKKLNFEWTSGGTFPRDLSKYALVVHCGACMLTRRMVQERIRACREAKVPIVNYGMAIARCHGIEVEPESVAVRRG